MPALALESITTGPTAIAILLRLQAWTPLCMNACDCRRFALSGPDRKIIRESAAARTVAFVGNP
jgi:hypothetical protein